MMGEEWLGGSIIFQLRALAIEKVFSLTPELKNNLNKKWDLIITPQKDYLNYIFQKYGNIEICYTFLLKGILLPFL